MRSPSTFVLLLGKELGELRASRAWWLLLAAMGPLTGHAFATAARAYSEASGSAGGPAALSQGLSPLDGFIVPVFGAYALAATLLLPFVAIRMLSAEKEDGGLLLMLQTRVRSHTMLGAKLWVLLGGWAVTLVPGLVALALWRAAGGHLAPTEVAVVLLGHLLRAALTCAIALAAAALTESTSTAAIVALAVTLATWALDFTAAVQGGLAMRLAAFTPEAALRTFEHGELSVAVVLVTLLATAGLVGVASLWLRPSRWPVRAGRMALLLGATVLALLAAARVDTSYDLSEDRRNSFPRADAAALRTLALRDPMEVEVEVHLGSEDPRLADLDRSVLRKLRRVLPRTRVRYVAATGTGLFDAPDARYGEVWYSIGGRRVMSRSTTPAIVLETLYDLAGVRRPADANDPPYPGYPVVIRAAFAPWLLALLWPLAVLAAWLWLRRPPPSSTPLA